MPNHGDKATMVGYPGTRFGGYRVTEGTIRRAREDSIVGFEYTFSRRALDGESGGPLFDINNKVIGVISQSARGSSIVTTLPKIKKFMEEAGFYQDIPSKEQDKWKPVETEKPKIPEPPKQEGPPKPKESSLEKQLNILSQDFHKTLKNQIALRESDNETRKKNQQLADERHKSLLEKIVGMGSGVPPSVGVIPVPPAGGVPVKEVAKKVGWLATTAGKAYLTGGVSLVTVGLGVGGWLYRRRKKREQQEQAPDTIPIGKTSSEIRDLTGQVEGIVTYLKDREGDEKRVSTMVKDAEGLTARETLAEDGKTTETTFWEKGVRLAREGSPIINVLGGPGVGRAIEQYVHREEYEQLKQEKGA